MIWHGTTVIEVLDKRLDRACRQASEFLAIKIKEVLDVSYPPASEPGEPPAKRTGTLQKSIKVVRVKRGEYQLTSDDPVALYMELGTSTIEPRPFFLPTVRRHKAEARQIVLLEAQKER